MLRADPWIVQAGGDGVRGQDLSVPVLQQVGQRAMEDAGRPEGEGPAVLAVGLSPTAGLHADQTDPGGTHERREDAHGVAAPPHTRHDRGGITALGIQELSLRLVADHALEVADQGGERMRPGYRTDHVMGLTHAPRPVPHGLVHRVLQRSTSGGDRHDLGPQELHPGDVRRLADGVLLAHVHDAWKAEQRAGRGGGHAVHPGAGLGDDATLPQPPGQEHLAQGVVDLVRAGVIQILTLQVDAIAQPVGPPRGEGQRRLPAHEVAKQRFELTSERRFVPKLVPGSGEFVEGRYQHLGDVSAPEPAEPASCVGHRRRVGCRHATPRSSRSFAPGSSARMRASPTSTAFAPASIARSTCPRVEMPLSSTAIRSWGTDPKRTRARSSSTSRLSRSRAFTPTTLASTPRALARSSVEWASTSAPSWRSPAALSMAFSSVSLRAAAMSSTASAPATRASMSWAG